MNSSHDSTAGVEKAVDFLASALSLCGQPEEFLRIFQNTVPLAELQRLWEVCAVHHFTCSSKSPHTKFFVSWGGGAAACCCSV